MPLLAVLVNNTGDFIALIFITFLLLLYSHITNMQDTFLPRGVWIRHFKRSIAAIRTTREKNVDLWAHKWYSIWHPLASEFHKQNFVRQDLKFLVE